MILEHMTDEEIIRALIEKLRMIFSDRWNVKNIMSILDEVPQCKEMLDYLTKNPSASQADVKEKAFYISLAHNHVKQNGFEYKKTR